MMQLLFVLYISEADASYALDGAWRPYAYAEKLHTPMVLGDDDATYTAYRPLKQ